MDKKFVNGLIVKRNSNLPDFVVCKLSFKTDEFIRFITDNSKNGWLNADVKVSKGGKYYAELDTYDGSTKNTSKSDENLKTMDTTKNEITNEIDPISPQIDPSIGEIAILNDINPEDIPF
jgi:hypothetical protein